jgi:hypothetical protein
MDIVEYHGRPMKQWEMDLNFPKPDNKDGSYGPRRGSEMIRYKGMIERGEVKPDTRLLDIVKKKKGPAPLVRTTTKVGKLGSATNPRVVTGISFVRGNIPQRGPHYHRWVDQNVPDDHLIIVDGTTRNYKMMSYADFDRKILETTGKKILSNQQKSDLMLKARKGKSGGKELMTHNKKLIAYFKLNP